MCLVFNKDALQAVWRTMHLVKEAKELTRENLLKVVNNTENKTTTVGPSRRFQGDAVIFTASLRPFNFYIKVNLETGAYNKQTVHLWQQ